MTGITIKAIVDALKADDYVGDWHLLVEDGTMVIDYEQKFDNDEEAA